VHCGEDYKTHISAICKGKLFLQIEENKFEIKKRTHGVTKK
jgi:hypothetical protein